MSNQSIICNCDLFRSCYSLIILLCQYHHGRDTAKYYLHRCKVSFTLGAKNHLLGVQSIIYTGCNTGCIVSFLNRVQSIIYTGCNTGFKVSFLNRVQSIIYTGCKASCTDEINNFSSRSRSRNTGL